MEIGSEGSLPQQPTESAMPSVGLPVTEIPQESSNPFVKLMNGIKNAMPFKAKGGSEIQPAVGSGLAEPLVSPGPQLDSGTPNTADFASASAPTVSEAGSAVDAASVLSDMNKQIDTTAQMGAQINNPIGGIPPVSMEAPTIATSPDTTPTPEPAPPTSPTDKAA